MEQVTSDGKKRKMNLYNLDMNMSRSSNEFIKSESFSTISNQATRRTTLVQGYSINGKRFTVRFSFPDFH